MPIKVLDDNLVSRIAAGEVVERPASVVKELLENSLDAGSSQVATEVRGGGVSLIRVIDNGGGIPSGEVEVAFERHATSKLQSYEDLQSIRSLGFRGEALPSIASVAQLEIITCAVGEQSGTYLNFEKGAVVSRRSQARSNGTTITVRNLFREVPARLKFLKATSTENSHIAGVVSQYALAFPEVAFNLVMDGRNSLHTSGQGRLMDSLVDVYGAETARNMLEIQDSNWEGGENHVMVKGLVGSPSISRASRGYLSFFVNRRRINSRLLSWAVEEAYHGLLMTGKHPIAVIDISLPSEELDINIHPTKSEVKFRDERGVFAAVQKAVRRTLVAQATVPRIEELVADYGSPSEKPQSMWASSAFRGNPSAVSLPDITPATGKALPLLRVLGQVLNTYIVAEGPDGLYIIDQHAAHERIQFEKVKRQRSLRQIEVQGLLEPYSLEISPEQDAVLQSHYLDLADFGFSVEPFGNKTCIVRVVPQMLYDKDWEDVLRDLLESLAGESSGDWVEKVAASIACHSAVRAGQSLTVEEMRELVRKMEATENSRTCPHGRPTVMCIGSAQLGKEFGRT